MKEPPVVKGAPGAHPCYLLTVTAHHYMQSRYWPTSKALLLGYFLIPGITHETLVAWYSSRRRERQTLGLQLTNILFGSTEELPTPRGMLFYRLLQQSVVAGASSYEEIIGRQKSATANIN